MLKDPDPGPNYAELMDDTASKKEANLPTMVIMIEEQSGLTVDLIFSFHERNESRDFFINLTPDDALRVTEVEPNFIYGALYNKVQVVHSRFGYSTRFISSASVVANLLIFRFNVNKSGFDEFDVGITYALYQSSFVFHSIFTLNIPSFFSASLEVEKFILAELVNF
ncbi:hypothetical protein LWI29_024567 [Acer saccharum]|uniref:DUF4220 domain-containing protein n=1 Tax=Acer saccharum TaxID=4024 RepID=A0AA39T7D3_ACESA|nr:hypothetical protein LWI29_024567 [Acer saccharum]